MGETQDDFTRQYEWNPEIACRTLEDTAFILHRSKMMSLNEVGTFIWEQFRNPKTIGCVVNAVLEEFDTAREVATLDVNSFCEHLVEREILTEVDRE